ncbi:MAG: class I SAM-dependent methyltransferase [Mycobacteriaceae bacterium]|nr:class I SAM-dependent methyltransferase [Mycobacteriaceae bacterium]
MTSVNGHRADATTLTGVSETALLTLRARANEARRPDPLIDDPIAVKLMDSIDYDFSKFGPARRQDVALRARAFDINAHRYLAAHPGATVVALAEGLQTSFWRLDAVDSSHKFRWLTVDLPPIIELRRRLLPRSPRTSVRAQSALDFSWMDAVDPADGVFITAEGLLMYLQPDEALGLIGECAGRFGGGQMMFDLPPPWIPALTRRGFRTSLRYKAPPMPFSLTVAEIADLVHRVPGIRAVHDMPLPRGRGPVFSLMLWTLQRLPMFDAIRPALTLLEFG